MTNNTKCVMNGCNKNADYYRDLDENPRPLCNEHHNKLMFLEKRHYIIINKRN